MKALQADGGESGPTGRGRWRGYGSLQSTLLFVFTACLLLFSVTFVHAAPPHRHDLVHWEQQSKPRGDQYTLGIGKADVTGPVVEIGMMGYASLSQKGTGLRQRIYSRAFLIGTSSDRIMYVITDLAMGDTGIRHAVLQKLNSMYPGVYTQSNLAIVGTHSHSGPGAWLNYLLPTLTTLGVDKQSFQAIVDGIVLSVKRAHEDARDGYLYLGKGMVDGAGVNRSPWAYEQNPEEERKRWESAGGETDKEMTVLAFEDAEGQLMGLLNWFPTHGTSLYNNNTLISGDNKGYAAIRLEKYLASLYNRPIITGFSQSNMGDVSPNTLGAVCQDTGLPCNYKDSTCSDGKSQLCHARGPGFRISDTESCRIIGERQFDAAKAILESILSGNGTPVTSSGGAATVRSFHTFINFGADNGGYKFTDLSGTPRHTCKAALGFSFAGGTTDGPGAFDFTQGDSGDPNNPFWLLVRNLLRTPSREQVACHEPKPILLDVGEMDVPYAWSPNIVDIQHFRVGQLAMIVAPGEATTMAGRRWREAVRSELVKREIISSDPWVVLGGPANTYSHYITTPEEYSVQRYEGASTLYGQYTLDAYIHATLSHLDYLSLTTPPTPPPPGPSPPIIAGTDKAINLNTGVVYDNPPIGKKFGDVLVPPKGNYSLSQAPTVEVVFVGANPRNNLRLEGDYVLVENKAENGEWVTVRRDEDWDVTYRWTRKDGLLGTSEVKVRWELGGAGGTSPQKGTYRVRYFGDAKTPVTGKIVAFVGVSGEFELV